MTITSFRHFLLLHGFFNVTVPAFLTVTVVVFNIGFYILFDRNLPNSCPT